MTKGFTDRKKKAYMRRAFEAINKGLASGFNYYPKSIELEVENTIQIPPLPIKFGHRDNELLEALIKAVEQEFGSIDSKTLTRHSIYKWLKTDYGLPKPQDRIRLYDLNQQRYITGEDGITNSEEFENASKNLLAHVQESSLLFLADRTNIPALVRFLVKVGNKTLIDEKGDHVRTADGDYVDNPDKLSDETWITPMIITSHDSDLEKQLIDFRPVRKLFLIEDQEEVSVYLDKTYEDFVKGCTIKFTGEKRKLANKTFRDYINDF